MADKMPSLAEITERVRRKRGKTDLEIGPVSVRGRPTIDVPPMDVSGKPMTMAPMDVSGGREITLPPMTLPTGGGRPVASRIGLRRQQLMAGGMSAEQAIGQMAKEGLIDPRMAQMMLRVPRAAGGVGG